MKTTILGAGYGGLAVATALKPTPGLDVTLLDRYPYHVYWTRLHEAAAHNTQITLPLKPLLRAPGVKLEVDTVQGVDLDSKTITFEDGRTQGYETLVVGLGSVTNFYRIPGLEEHATELKDLKDSDDIFNFINRAYDASFEGPRDIVVGGAGLTGVELVTELAKRNAALAHQRHVDPLKIYLVEAADKILPVLDESLRRAAQATMDEYGIVTLLNHKIMGAEANSVKVQLNGQDKVIEAGKIIWTGGIKARDILKGEKLEKGPGGRAVVDRSLRLTGYQEVFVVGDMALGLNQEGKPVPTTAQHAGQEGRLTAANLMRLARGEALAPYEPHTQGEFVSLGGLMAVGWMQLPGNQKLAMTGGFAHIMKRASEWRWRLSISPKPNLS